MDYDELILVGRLPFYASIHLPGKWHKCKLCAKDIYLIDELKEQAQKMNPQCDFEKALILCIFCSAIYSKMQGNDTPDVMSLETIKKNNSNGKR